MEYHRFKIIFVHDKVLTAIKAVSTNYYVVAKTGPIAQLVRAPDS